MKMKKITGTTEHCVDCPHAEYNRMFGLCCPKFELGELPESGIHKKCKLEDYKVKK